jgi:hypothetical protein
VCELVLDDPAPLVPLLMSKRGKQVDYEAKTVTLAGRRYIVGPTTTRWRMIPPTRRLDRRGAKRQLNRGDKTLVGNVRYPPLC